jgi:thiol-disulfide isomerase/thioredoxin
LRKSIPIIFLAVSLTVAACSGDGATLDGYFDGLAAATCDFEEASANHLDTCNLTGPFDTEEEEMAAVVSCYSGLRDVVGVHSDELDALTAPEEVASDHELVVNAGADLVGDFDALIAELNSATTMTEMEEKFASFVPPSEGANDRYASAMTALQDYASANAIAADFACAGGDPILGATVEISGDPLAPVGTNPDPAFGTPAPVIRGVDFGGNSVEAGGASGKPTAILLVAHWCGYCQDEIPAVQQWINQNGEPEAIDLVSIITFNNPDRLNYPPDTWLREEGWTVPVIIDDARSSAMNALGGTAVPYWVLLDADGNVIDRFTGTATVDEVLSRFPGG